MIPIARVQRGIALDASGARIGKLTAHELELWRAGYAAGRRDGLKTPETRSKWPWVYTPTGKRCRKVSKAVGPISFIQFDDGSELPVLTKSLRRDK